MANDHTEHYELPIWDAGDRFLRTEFNEAHQKIDAALAGMATGDELEAVEELAQSRAWLVTGTYTGDGADSQTIELGFQPKAVLVVPGGGLNAECSYETGAQLAFPNQASHLLSVTASGFKVSGGGSGGLNSDRTGYNPFFYVAMR